MQREAGERRWRYLAGLGGLQREAGAAGKSQPEVAEAPVPVTPMKRLLNRAGEVVRSAKRVLLGGEGDD